MQEENNNTQLPSYFAIIPANVRYDSNLQQGSKLLYGEITALCSVKGFCWASNAHFAELYDTTERTISRWISSLQSAGYISVEFVYHEGGKKVKQRNIGIDPVMTKMSVNDDKNVQINGDKNVVGSNTSISNTNNKDSSSGTKVPDCPHDKILSLYHECLPMLPKVRQWTTTRKKHLAARWKSDKQHQSLDFWERYFKFIAKSDFLTGKSNSFKATLAWLVKEENFAKVIEKNYVNREAPQQTARI